MDVLSDVEIDAIAGSSKLVAKYNQTVDPESAYEILNAKLEEAAEKTKEQQEEVAEAKQTKKTAKKEEGFFDNPMVKSVGKTAANIITRSLLGALGLGGRTSSKRKKSFF
jgi:hypothetical protein